MIGGDIERRSFIEVRTAGRRITGYAATFGSEAQMGGFVEVIAPGAFRAALAGDILALMDHDASKVLGRTRSGTLKLSEDSKGLAFELSIPDTSAGHDLLALAERGDIGGMSFGFRVPPGGDTWDGDRRTLRTIDLREISVVSSWPAYSGTEIALRSRPRDDADRHRAFQFIEACKWA